MTGTAANEHRLTDHFRQSLAINDAIMQRLAVAAFHADEGDLPAAAEAIARSIVATRDLMRQLTDAGDLPVAGHVSCAPGTPAVEAVASTADGDRRIRAVVADDTDDVRDITCRILRRAGDIDVVALAEDGQEAIDAVTRFQPELLVLDLSMPRMDGLTALQHLRPHLSRTKVVVLSGYGSDQAARRALDLGASAYVEKGTAMRPFLDVVRALFPSAAKAPHQTAPRPSSAGA